MTQVFISYSRMDTAFVQRLAADLEGEGLNVWWDITDIQGSDVWEQKIEAGLNASTYFIVVLSPDSLVSRWVRREYLSADSKGLKIIPLKLRAYNELPLTLRDIQPVNAIDRKYEDVLSDVLGILNFQEFDHVRDDDTKSLESSNLSITDRTETPFFSPERLDFAGMIAFLAFFLFLSFSMFDDSSDELRALAAISGFAAGYWLWRGKQMPGGSLFKYGITIFFFGYDFLLLYYTTDWQIPGAEIYAGVGAMIMSLAIIASMQLPKRAAMFGTIFLAIFIFLTSIHLGLNALSVYPSWPHIPSIAISVLAGVLIWREM